MASCHRHDPALAQGLRGRGRPRHQQTQEPGVSGPDLMNLCSAAEKSWQLSLPATSHSCKTLRLLKKFSGLAGQALDALGDGRMSGEQAAKIHAQQRLHDE